MNSSKTPKIVIGVGLAAVYAAGFAFFALSGARDNAIPQSASIAQTSTDAVSPTDNLPTSVDVFPEVVDEPAAMAAATEPVSVAQSKDVESSPKAEEADVRSRSKAPALASVTASPPVEEPAVEQSSAASEGTNSSSESADTAEEAPSSAVAESTPSGNDVQITAEVKSQIAAVAPAGAIEVTTTDGVVELTGSVPSEEVIGQALMAARNVPAVRDVDVSELTISN